MWFMWWGCQTPQIDVHDMKIGEQSLVAAIDEIKSNQQAQRSETLKDLKIIIDRLDKIDDRLKQAEIALVDLRPPTYSASDIVFSPLKTKIEADNIQLALEQLEKRLREVEAKAQDMGQPGPGLFELDDPNRRRTDRGNPQKGPPPEQSQGNQGPGGPPPSGGQGPGGPPPGGQGPN